MCILCNKIKASPSLLHIFFLDRSWLRYPIRNRRLSQDERPISPTSMSTITSRGVTSKPDSEFLLFTYLLRWVHREGRTGDLARAAISLLIEVTISSNDGDGDIANEEISNSIDIKAAVAEFMVDGDLADVLAAGLGAVYGILPANLAVVPTDPSDKEQKPRQIINRGGYVSSVELSTSLSFKNHLWVFLSVFEFTADIVKRGLKSGNKYGIAIAENILEAIKHNFLGSVLYPSILECSSLDYSAVAVMSYLEIMLTSINSGPLADVLLDYLFTDDDNNNTNFSYNNGKDVNDNDNVHNNKKHSKHDRRRSTALVLLQNENAAQRKQTSDYFSSLGRFTLKDLILLNVRSKSEPTSIATLKLFSYLMYTYDQICSEKLINITLKNDCTAFPYFHSLHSMMKDEEHLNKLERIENEIDKEELFPPPPTIRNVNKNDDELNKYLMIIGSIDAQTSQEMLSTGYERYLEDAQLLIINHNEFKKANNDNFSKQQFQQHHLLDLNDKLLEQLLESLKNFFLQSPDQNIALSGAIASLAINPRRSLEGWMTLSFSSNAITEDVEKKGKENEIRYPIILEILQSLADQIENYRMQVRNNKQDFDLCLSERRRGMLFKENLEDALALLDEVEPSDRSELVKQFEEGVAIGAQNAKKSRSSNKINNKKKDYGIGKGVISHKRYQDSIDTDFEKRIERNNSWGISNLTAKADKFLTKPKARSATSSLAALFNPKKKNNEKENYNNETQQRKVSAFEGPATPFYEHYKQTELCKIKPVNVNNINNKNNLNESDENENDQNDQQYITLSHLLENVVIFEEMLKEYVAIIQIRRSLGIDLVCLN